MALIRKQGLPPGGTTGQVPKKTSGADYAVTWGDETGGAANASESVTGVARLSSQVQADAGTDDATIMTPLKVATRPQKNLAFETHIEGLKLTWNAPGTNGNLLTVSSGAAWIQSLGKIYNVPSTITGPTQTLSASAFHYVYLYDNSGTPAIEITTVAPASPYKGTARSRGSDTSRRLIGVVLTDGGGTPVMRPFLHLGDEMLYTTPALVTPWRAIDGVGPGSGWTSKSIATILPPAISTDMICMLTTGTLSTAGLCYLEHGLASGSRFAILGGYISVGGQFAFGTTWLPVLPTTPSFFYNTVGPAGSSFYVDITGYKFVR